VDARTSNIPFAALVTGAGEWRPLLEELKLTNAAAAVVVAAALSLRRVSAARRAGRVVAQRIQTQAAQPRATA